MKHDFWADAEEGDVETLTATLDAGQPIDAFDDRAPLTALHYAVARDQLDAAKLLVARGAPFLPDGFGRMPSTLACIVDASEEMLDFIVEAEGAWEQRQEQLAKSGASGPSPR